MHELTKFFIGGEWRAATGGAAVSLHDPATGERNVQLAVASEDDVNSAVSAAQRAFDPWALTEPHERVAILRKIAEEIDLRKEELAEAVTSEMGAPLWLSQSAHVSMAPVHFTIAADVLDRFQFERRSGNTLIRYEPIGVCGLITPWNWPLNQICAKLAPALAAGCTVVLKPSEFASLSAVLLAEAIEAAGVPAGVFNLVLGDASTGAEISAHPSIAMVSFTGSTRAGIDVAVRAAPSVKRVHQELGGKSPSVVLDGADLPNAVATVTQFVLLNSGQTCSAPTRLIVPRSKLEQACEIASGVCEAFTVGDPRSEARMGPVVSAAQWNRVQALIKAGVDEGARLVTGGLGKPEGLDRGYYCKPTVFADVHNDMRIAQEEIFGPVLSIVAYDDIEEAIGIANDSPYGLAGYVWGATDDEALAVARRLAVGQIILNGAAMDMSAPFGGYKASGNGREWGELGFEAYLEIKAIVGAASPDMAAGA
mgnify:CR=1 FL=1